MAVATDDSRSRLRGSDLPVAFLAIARPLLSFVTVWMLEFRRAPR
jgi:hypothetical protein